jgi:hypothetical protein
VLTIYGGPEWAPGAPNQRDHMEFAAAVVAAYDGLTDPPRWLFQSRQQVRIAKRSTVSSTSPLKPLPHTKSISPDWIHTPVVDQARKVLDMTTPARAPVTTAPSDSYSSAADNCPGKLWPVALTWTDAPG